MELISKALFGIANSLLIPDIILLILFFFRALLMVGGTYNSYMTRRRNSRLFDEAIKELSPEKAGELRDRLPARPDSLFTKYLADLLEKERSEDYADYMLTRFETEAAKEVNTSHLLTKTGPILGLIGTLISMSPALVGLSSGDISGMAYNMQVVFASTVVGLLISAVGLTTYQLKQRWYAKDINNLDYVARVICPKTGTDGNGRRGTDSKEKGKEDKA